jgi:L-lactate utilization protein LutC
MNSIIEKFKTNAELTTATVDIVSFSKITDTINKYVENENKVLLSINDKSLLSLFPQNLNWIQNPSREELTNIAIALTDCACGIAETGSVVVNNDTGNSSYLSMLSTKHIVILDSSKLFDRLRDIFSVQELKKSNGFSIITGPSATADMGSLVRGVHGPQHLHIIVKTN